MPVHLQRRSTLAWAVAPWLAALAGPGQAAPSVTGQPGISDLNDAINQAGRQRMLSQRMAKGWLAQGQGIQVERARQIQADSMALFERQLQSLREFAPSPAIAGTYDALATRWADYRQALTTLAPSPAHTPGLIALDGQVLSLAHRGTIELESLANKPVARLVNLAGRQRMLTQRMAKYFLVQHWRAGVPGAAAQAAMARSEFSAALDVLNDAPEATPLIRQQIELGRAQWVFFANALARVDGGQATAQNASDMFASSENLLQVMDRITVLYARVGGA